MIRRILTTLLLLLVSCGRPLFAQDTTFETVTFAATSIGLTSTTLNLPGSSNRQVEVCVGKLETGAIRIRFDGTAPTDAVGALVDVGNTVRVTGNARLRAFRGIRTTGTSGTVAFHCSSDPAFDLDPTVSVTLAAGDNDIGNVDLEFAGTAAATNTGTNSAQTLRVTVATDDEINDALAAIQTAAQISDNPVYVDDADFTDGTSSLFGVGAVAEAAAPSTVTEGDMGMLAMTLNRAMKVTIFNSSGTELTSGDVTEDAGETAGGTGPFVLNVRRDVAASSAGATADNASFNTDALGLLWTRNLDPCSGVAKTYLPIDITTATTTEITPSLSGSSTYYYVCALNLVTALANNVSLVDDNSDGCGSVTAALVGGLTAAEGWNFAANGGIALGNGTGSIMRAVTANSVLCLVTSGTTQLAGQIVVAAAP